MEHINYEFRGLMSPVFTAFSHDGQHVLYDKIDAYGKYLKEKGVNGVLVNGTSGEGTCLSLLERATTAECWKETCTKYGLSLMLQIGGTSIADVHHLALHAAAIKADAILCLPDLFFKPKTEEALVRYFQGIAQRCPKIPLLYYHIPAFTSVSLNLPRFLDLAEAAIANFVGLKYTSGDLEVGVACLKENRRVFLGADTLLAPALALGFDSSIMTTLNICPELSMGIMRSIDNNNLTNAADVQRQLTYQVNKILLTGDWVNDMKMKFNRVCPLLHMGPTRKPL